MEDGFEINGQIFDGEFGREHGPFFDHEVRADRYNSLMDNLETMK